MSPLADEDDKRRGSRTPTPVQRLTHRLRQRGLERLPSEVGLALSRSGVRLSSIQPADLDRLEDLLVEIIRPIA